MKLRLRLVPAVLTCALALAACGDGPSRDAAADGGATGSDRSSQTAQDTTGRVATEIPDDFPLAAGMGGPQDDLPTSRTGTGLRDLELCGATPLRGLGLRDRMVVDNSGGESADTRELVLLGNADEAADVARAFADLPSGCEEPDVSGDTETITEVRQSPFGDAPATTLVQVYTFDGRRGRGATVIHVVPVGAALLVTSTYGDWNGDTLDLGLSATADRLQETVAALAVFDTGSDPSDEPSPEPVTPIPADFPLAVGMVEDGGDYDVSEPSADGDGMGQVEMCGRVVWPAADTSGGPVARLVTGAVGPEYADSRELLVHADAEQALAAMAAIRTAAAECRSFDNQVWTVLDRDTGYDTVTMGLTYSDGLGSSVFQVTRVGSARLMVQTYGEGSLASLDDDADQVTETTGKIVPAMCVFTKTGC